MMIAISRSWPNGDQPRISVPTIIEPNHSPSRGGRFWNWPSHPDRAATAWAASHRAMPMATASVRRVRVAGGRPSPGRQVMTTNSAVRNSAMAGMPMRTSVASMGRLFPSSVFRLAVLPFWPLPRFDRLQVERRDAGDLQPDVAGRRGREGECPGAEALGAAADLFPVLAVGAV